MSIDLSAHHEMVGSGFVCAASCEDPSLESLSETELGFFEQNGYVKGGRVLDDAQVEILRLELSTFLDPSHDGNDLWYEYNSNESTGKDQVLFHALGAWRITPGFHDLLWHLPWLSRASQLLNGAVRFWHDQLFCKPAEHGGVVAWHQDFSYWTRTSPMSHLTCWIALDDATKENGCVHYVAGSHRWDLLPVTGLAGGMEEIAAVLTDEQLEAFRNATPVELAAGECVFHHPLTIHGSFENRSSRSRRATVVNVFSDGVKSATDEELLHGVPVIAAGQKMEGPFFPLLYDRVSAE